jgi:hypothetical protein
MAARDVDDVESGGAPRRGTVVLLTSVALCCRTLYEGTLNGEISKGRIVGVNRVDLTWAECMDSGAGVASRLALLIYGVAVGGGNRVAGVVQSE